MPSTWWHSAKPSSSIFQALQLHQLSCNGFCWRELVASFFTRIGCLEWSGHGNDHMGHGIFSYVHIYIYIYVCVLYLHICVCVTTEKINWLLSHVHVCYRLWDSSRFCCYTWRWIWSRRRLSFLGEQLFQHTVQLEEVATTPTNQVTDMCDWLCGCGCQRLCECGFETMWIWWMLNYVNVLDVWISNYMWMKCGWMVRDCELTFENVYMKIMWMNVFIDGWQYVCDSLVLEICYIVNMRK
jgi:hypothetical protein